MRKKSRCALATTRILGLLALTVATLAIASPARADLGIESVSGFAPRPGGGWYITGPDGMVDAGGPAPYLGDMHNHPLNQQVTGIAATESGQGYWLLASDGGIFSFGDARFFGSTGAIPLKAPIVGMAPTRSGNGYWMVASDGGIFSFGDARFLGSTGAIPLNAPIVGMAPTRSGNGYWMVASDGGIFSFGDARFLGSTGGSSGGAPIVGMASTRSGDGYWLVDALGRVFAFGDARLAGDAVGQLFGPAIGIVALPGSSGGYTVVDTGGYHTFRPGSDPVHVRSLSTVLGAGLPGAIGAEMVARVNSERAARGIVPLSVSGALSADATALAHAMADRLSLVHLADLNSLLLTHGATAGAENIYTGTGADTPALAHLLWMNSDVHRLNLLNPGFDTVGVGVACRDGKAFASMLLLRRGSAPLSSAVPPRDPITRADNDANSPLHCS